MPISGFRVIPTNTAEWDRFFRGVPVIPDPASVGPDQLQANAVMTVNLQDDSVTTPKLDDAAVTNGKLALMPAVSVKSRASATDGSPGDTVAAADNTFLARRAGQLVFDPLVDADIPGSIARDTEVIAAIASALTPYDTRLVADTRNVLLSTVLNGSATYDPPSLIDGSEASTTVSVVGAALGDFALASFSLSTAGIKLSAEVTATDTVMVNFSNHTGGTLDLSSGTLKARVWK